MLAASLEAQSQKIVCWKDKTGKVIGCGDRVPPEYRQNEAKILDSRGLTRETRLSAEEEARQKEEEKKRAAQQAEEDRRIAEQRRQDTALINTYTSPKEIDVRRDRELQVVSLQIQQLKASLQNAIEAHENQVKRHATFEKRGKVPDNVRDDLARSADEVKRIENSIGNKEKQKVRIGADYAQQKSRFLELKGLPAAGGGSAAKK